MLKFVGRYFYCGLLQYFPKNILVQKLGAEEKKLPKSGSGYFMTKKIIIKKNSTTFKALMALPIRKDLFFGFPLITKKKGIYFRVLRWLRINFKSS